MTNSLRQNDVGPASHFRLRTFGSAVLLRRSEHTTAFEPVPLVGKQFALLAYLMCSPNRAASRTTLTELFAPKTSGRNTPTEETKAGDAVRNLIQQLRTKLGADALGPLRSDPVRLSIPLECDRDELIEAWGRRDFERVAEAYGGDFLPRFEIVGGAGFALWVETERSDLRRRFTHAARQVILRDLSTPADLDAARRALQNAMRLRDEDSMSQEAWRLMLRALVQSGRYAEASVEGERLLAFLASHQIEPAAETKSLLSMMRTLEMPRSDEPTERGRERPDRTVSLVGRDREVSTILKSWERARLGAFSHVHLVAAAGLGKSALVDDFRQRLRMRPSTLGGTKVVEARASYASRDTALSFASEVARALVERPGALGIPEWAAATLVALNPTLATVYRGSTSTQRPGNLESNPAIVSALKELIAAIALEAPVAISLDDVHWADARSLEILSEAFAGCAELTVLLVSAGRNGCESLCAATRATTHVLTPLSVLAVKELLARKAQLPAEEWAELLPSALTQATSGSPLLVVETLQLLLERQLLTPTAAGWIAHDPTSLIETLNEGSATRRRLERLSEVERDLLLILSVSGAPLAATPLRAASAQTLAEFTASLTSLERRGFVSRRVDEWSIAHDEYAMQIRELSGTSASRAVATRLARAIIADSGDDLRAFRRAGMLLAESGDASEAARVFERYVRLCRLQRDRRPDSELASEFLGGSAEHKSMQLECVRRLPLLVRARLVSSRRIAAISAICAVALVAIIAIIAITQRPPDRGHEALLVASRMSEDRSSREHFLIPLDASHIAGISIIDVRLPHAPLWRSAAGGVGGRNARPDGRGWTAGLPVADSGVIDVFELALDGTARRITFAPSDDYEPSWAPDNSRFAFVTARWSQHGHYDIAVFDTLTKTTTQLTSGDDTDWEPSWSSDGSRIAFVRQYAASGRRGLCVVDADGQNLRCFPADTIGYLSIPRWADPRHLLLRRDVGARHELERVGLDSGDAALIGAHEPGVTISPDGRFGVCQCIRQGYPPRTWIVYPIDRPNEFAVLRVEDDRANDVEFDWAPTSPRPPFVDRMTISLGLGPPILGSSHQLTAEGLDATGKTLSPGVVRWASEDTSIATIDTLGRLTPRKVGSVMINASAGGWRIVRTPVSIREPASRVLLDEDWSHGLEPVWRSFGIPKPVLVSTETFAHAFLNNGDGSFFSGAYTSSGFSVAAGIWLDAEISTPIRSTESQEQVVELFAIMPKDAAAWAGWDHLTGDGPAGTQFPRCGIRYPAGVGGANFGKEMLVEGVWSTALLTAPPSLRSGRPHRLTIQLFPDGRCGVAINGNPLWTGPATFSESTVHIGLAGNSVNTNILIGRLRVGTGIAPGLVWEPGVPR
jgi:DNA-binding SARP family transcriptional activator